GERAMIKLARATTCQEQSLNQVRFCPKKPKTRPHSAPASQPSGASATRQERFIDGARRCCAVSTARSRAAATTNLARSNQSLFLRALVNLFMTCPNGRLDEILPLITAISWH